MKTLFLYGHEGLVFHKLSCFCKLYEGACIVGRPLLYHAKYTDK